MYQKTASSSSSSPIESISNKQGKYLTLTPDQRFEVGKRGAEHSVTAALKTACENTSMRIRSGIVLICAYLNVHHQFAKVYSTNDVLVAISPKFAPSKISLYTVHVRMFLNQKVVK